ncbi:hypothetical protein BOX15_Mlig026991g1 [Macrostomum lignano]|uniref:MFS domain-containing protein n=2 Tax=Macrostomum lignano TaxID=282301 RepID=A0A1I8I1W1_9PLAT|nr:hypothetical protein BOX15_Mlig026991g1 [Macrostomum lignano]
MDKMKQNQKLNSESDLKVPVQYENKKLSDVEGEADSDEDNRRQLAQPPRLSVCRKILFGLAAPPLQMTSNICGFFFSIFLLEVVKMSPVYVSIITFSGRAWDAITDPLVGQLVFRTDTRLGRTKPWLIGASLMGPVSFFLMWIGLPAINVDGDESKNVQTFFYYFACYLAYCAMITCYHVPYTSSTVLISNNPSDKDGATASRIGFELIFTIIGSGVFGVIISSKRVNEKCQAGGLKPNFTEEQLFQERQSYMIAAGIISAIYLICGIFAIFGIKERVKDTFRQDSFFKNIRCVLTFKPYLLLMFAFLFMSLGIQIVQANLGLYTTHSVKLSSHMSFGIVTVLSVAVLFVPFWYKMADMFGKKKIFMCGLIPMFPCLLFATFMPADSLICYYSVCAVSGLSISVAMLMPWSMLPDVIDDYYVKNGERKESVFYSLYVFFTKFASGISLALSQLALYASGYNSEQTCDQPESVGLALRYLVGPGPVVCIAISMLLMCFYPIDKAYRLKLNDDLIKKFGVSGKSLELSKTAASEEYVESDENSGCVSYNIDCDKARASQVETDSGGSGDSGNGSETKSTDCLLSHRVLTAS